MYNTVLEPIYTEVTVEREGVFKTLILNIAEPIFAKVLRNECVVNVSVNRCVTLNHWLHSHT